MNINETSCMPFSTNKIKRKTKVTKKKLTLNKTYQNFLICTVIYNRRRKSMSATTRLKRRKKTTISHIPFHFIVSFSSHFTKNKKNSFNVGMLNVLRIVVSIVVSLNSFLLFCSPPTKRNNNTKNKKSFFIIRATPYP